MPEANRAEVTAGLNHGETESTENGGERDFDRIIDLRALRSRASGQRPVCATLMPAKAGNRPKAIQPGASAPRQSAVARHCNIRRSIPTHVTQPGGRWSGTNARDGPAPYAIGSGTCTTTEGSRSDRTSWSCSHARSVQVCRHYSLTPARRPAWPRAIGMSNC